MQTTNARVCGGGGGGGGVSIMSTFTKMSRGVCAGEIVLPTFWKFNSPLNVIFLEKIQKGDSKELERDVTTTAMAKAILRLKTLAFIPS